MRPLILAAAVCLTLLCAGRTSADDTDDEPDCDSTTMAMLECAIERSRQADLDLERYLAAARKQLAEDAIDYADYEYTAETLPRFEAAQSAWTEYRENECSAVHTATLGGGFRDVMYQMCWANMTEARTASIWSTWLTNSDRGPPLLPEPGH